MPMAKLAGSGTLFDNRPGDDDDVDVDNAAPGDETMPSGALVKFWADCDITD